MAQIFPKLSVCSFSQVSWGLCDMGGMCGELVIGGGSHAGGHPGSVWESCGGGEILVLWGPFIPGTVELLETPHLRSATPAHREGRGWPFAP